MDRKGIVLGVLGLVTAITLAIPASPALAATTQRTATGLARASDSVFPETVVQGGQVFGRTRVKWSSAKEPGRSASYAVAYSWGQQVQGVKAPAYVRALYFDRATQTNVLARLSFIRQTSVASASDLETERFFHVSTEASAYPLFAGKEEPFFSATPVITGPGVSDALLSSMYYDPTLFTIVSATWDGPQTQTAKSFGRWAVYTLRRTGMTYSAIYGADVSLPDVRVFDGVAYYSSEATSVAEAKRAETPTPTVTTTPTVQGVPFKPRPKPRNMWPYVAGAAAAVAALGMVVFWYKRRKKRADGEDDEQEEFDAHEFHDPDAQDD